MALIPPIPKEVAEKYADVILNKTNADRIRSMSDEELAEWISSIMECDDGCPCIKECGEKEELGFCYPSMLEWLRKEVDDGCSN